MILLGLYWLLLLAAAVQDLRTLTIPNALALAVFAASVLLVVFVRASAPWPFLASFGIVLAFGFALFSLGWMGGGDAKLAAAAAALFAPPELPWFAFAVTFSGAILLIVLVLSGQLKTRPADGERATLRSRKVLPYGVAIAIGAAVTSIWAIAPEIQAHPRPHLSLS